jgi:hypothetical protein
MGTIPVNVHNYGSMQQWRQIAGADHARITGAQGKPEGEGGIVSFFKWVGDNDYAKDNKAAFANLMSSINNSYAGRANAAMAVLQAAYDAGEPLTSRLVQKAIHVAENSIAHILDKYDDASAVFSPIKKEGNTLSVDPTFAHMVTDVAQFWNNKVQEKNPADFEQEIQILKDMLKDINEAPSVSANIKSKVGSFVQANLERIQLLDNVSKLEIPFLKNVADKDLMSKAHTLVIDGDQLTKPLGQALGRWRFENERGYLAGMLKGFNLMLTTLNTKFDANMLKDFHDAAIGGVHDRDRFDSSSAMDRGYRDGAVQFGLVANDNCTAEGLKEFQASPKKTSDWITVTPPKGQESGMLVANEKTPQQCARKAQEIINAYHMEISDADGDEDGILAAITRCCQDLDQHHLFSDGNARTLGFLVMNKLLLQNGLRPVVLEDPNRIDMNSIDELVAEIKKSQAKFDTTFPPKVD